MKLPIALSVAGSDPSGGAGIQADLKTFSALGVYGAAVVTALTAQNTLGVRGVWAPPAAFVGAQLGAVLEDLEVDAVKLGMLGTGEIVREVAGLLRGRGLALVVDPVMVAKGGAPLLDEDALSALIEQVLPLATVLTPNLPEAAALLRFDERRSASLYATDEAAVLADMPGAARRLLSLGPRAVLLKGGHAGGPTSADLLCVAGDDHRGASGLTLEWLVGPRVKTRNTHGTGCTLAAAVAAGLARGLSVADAARAAKEYVSGAVAAGAGLQIGHGHGPVHHFYALWRQAEGA